MQPGITTTFVAVVGVMMVREIVIRATSKEDFETKLREATIDRESGEWNLAGFQPTEATIKVGEVQSKAATMIADARQARDSAVRMRERLNETRAQKLA